MSGIVPELFDVTLNAPNLDELGRFYAKLGLRQAILGFGRRAEEFLKQVAHDKGDYSEVLSFVIALFSAGTCSSSLSNFTPVSASRTGGSWLRIVVTSPVSLLAPPPGPEPALMMTIFSVFASGAEI